MVGRSDGGCVDWAMGVKFADYGALGSYDEYQSI